MTALHLDRRLLVAWRLGLQPIDGANDAAAGQQHAPRNQQDRGQDLANRRGGRRKELAGCQPEQHTEDAQQIIHTPPLFFSRDIIAHAIPQVHHNAGGLVGLFANEHRCAQ